MMKQHPLSCLKSARVAAILTGTILAAAPCLHAAQFTWVNTTGNWDVPANWVGGEVPEGFNVDDELIFGGAVDGPGYISTHNLFSPFLLNRLTLNSASTVANTLAQATSNSLGFVADINNLNPSINQNGVGAFVINLPFSTNAPLALNSVAGGGLVTLNGGISGGSALTINNGNWIFGSRANTWTSGIVISGGATVEVKPNTLSTDATSPGLVAISGAESSLGNGGTITLNNGTLKLTPHTDGNISLGGDRTIAFGMSGGLLQMVNATGGNVTGSLAITTTAGGTVGVIQFNGGANGLSSNKLLDGNWTSTNRLNFRSISGAGPLRVELTNGATLRAGTGGANTITVATPTTIRGVLGGNPTSPTGEKNVNISRDTGRLVLDGSSVVNYTGGLIFENAVQVHGAGSTRGLDGNITIAGLASGNPGYVAFSGRGTGTKLGPTINEPGIATEGQNVLWLGRDGNDTLTIQDGGTAVMDARIRYDQANNHGVLLNAQTRIEGGGTLRFYQSLSNASGVAFKEGQTNVSTTANVGNHIVQGNIIGQGSTAKNAQVDIYLPVGNAITGTPADNSLPYGGVVFAPSSNLVVNGTGFGGLRVNGLARANTLFTGSTADPISNVSKVNNLLTQSRVFALSGTGGYLTVAPAGETYTFPNAEWATNVPVGLKVVDHNAGGIDAQFDPAKISWGHDLAVDAGATLSTGTNAFSLIGGTLHGNGTVSGAGGLNVTNTATVSPGMDGIGTLNVGDLTLSGTYLAELTSNPASDLLAVGGNLILGSSSILQLAPGSTFNNSNYTLLTYTGTRTGTFGFARNVPLGFKLNYDTAGEIRLAFGPVLTWNGTPGANWSTAAGNANWQGGGSFVDGEQVLFNDTAADSTTVTISGNVSPALTAFNNSTKDYVIIGSAGNAISGDGALQKDGTGVVELRGSHTYQTGTTINAGTLRLGNSDALPDVGPVVVASGGNLDLNGHTDTIEDLTVGGAVTGGTLTVGDTTLTAGGAISANLILSGNVAKTGAGAATISGTIDLGGAVRSFDVSGETSPGLTIGGVISNGSFTKAGAGLAILGVVNTYAGGTSVTGGTLRAGVAGAIPEGALNIQGDGTADLNNFNYTATSLTGNGTLALGTAQLTLNPSAPAVFTGAINGSTSAIVKMGNGVQTLGGPGTFSGGVDIQAGRLNLTHAAAAGTGAINVQSGASIQIGAALTNNITFAENTTISGQTGGANLGTGTWNLTGPSSIFTYNRDTNGGVDMIFTGVLAGSGDLDVQTAPAQANADTGPGLRFRGEAVSTYSGTITAGQRVKLEIQMNTSASPNPIGAGNIVLVTGTSTGELGGTYVQLQPRLNGAGQTHILGTDVALQGAGYANINILGAADVVAQFGELTIGAGQILGASKNDAPVRTVSFPTVNLTGGMAEFRAFDPGFGQAATTARGGSSIVLGDISESTLGAGFIAKATDPVFIEVAGTASYTGPTDIQAGTLRVSAEGSLTTSSEIRLGAGTKLDVTAHLDGYTIPSGQKLVGSGDWDGRLAFGGTLAPGAGLGMMTGDDFTLQGTAVMQFELSGLDNTSDRLLLTGAFDKGTAGAFQFDFEGGGLAGQTYSLVQFANTTFAGSEFTFIDLAPGLTATFQVTGTELQLAVVPEPSSAVALAMGAALLGLRRRRQS